MPRISLPRPSARPAAAVAALVALLPGFGVSVARADPAVGASTPRSTVAVVPQLAWVPCGWTPEAVADGVQCAVADLPLDYRAPSGEQVHIAVAKVPARDTANRIGSLFFNVGGPGGAEVADLQTGGAGVFAALNQRFDIVGFDPRGVGESTPTVDCRVPTPPGPTTQRFPTPLTIDKPAFVAGTQAYVDACLRNNGAVLQHLSTANVARDMDAMRAAVGDARLTYVGFSYGTQLGATYAQLFPDRYRALVLDGPVDVQQWIHDPMDYTVLEVAGFEDALDRFLAACTADQSACSGFGGSDPALAYDDLVAAADSEPIPAPGYTPDPSPVSGDDIRSLTSVLLYDKGAWGVLALALAEAARGNGTVVRALLSAPSGGLSGDATLAINASEAHYPRGDPEVYFDRGAASWVSFPHFWFMSGYFELAYGLWPVSDADAYGGPWAVPASSPTPLVVATTHDPATPYPGAQRLVADLANARLLTMDGDGHTAYGAKSACIDTATEAYLVAGTLPAPGTVCQQTVPFAAPTVPAEAAIASLRPRPGPVLPAP
jgi:pimeloyl-ACP methyl ester carboxylesterase